LSPLCALLIGRMPMPLLVSMAAVVFATGFAAVAASTQFWQVPVAYASALAIAEVLLGMLTANAMITGWFERRRGLAFGVCSVGAPAGGLIVPPAAAYLVVHYGWRHTYLTLAMVALVILVPAAWLLIREQPTPEEFLREHPTTGEVRPLIAQKPEGEALSYSQLVRRGDFWLYSFFVAICLAASAGAFVSLVPFAMEQGTSYAHASLLTSCVAAAAVVGMLAFGAYSDRMSIGSIMLLVVLTNLVGITLMLPSRSFATLLLPCVALGLGVGGIVPLWGTLVARVYGVVGYAKTLGLMRFVVISLMPAGPLLAGWLHDREGSYTLAYSVFIVSLLLAGLIPLSLKRSPTEEARALPVNESKSA
jgi:MFS family permease